MAIVLALVSKPARANDLGRCFGDEGETGESWRFDSDGSLLVGTYEQGCDPCLDANGEVDEDAAEPVTLFRVGSGLKRLTAFQDKVSLEAVDGGRILVREGSNLVLYSSSGKRGLSIAADAQAGGLSGDDLVGAGSRVKVFSAKTGSLKWTRTPPKGGRFVEAENGFAVYVTTSAVHLLRLRDGKDLVAAKTKNVVDADLEASGLYYGHNSGKGDKPGRVTFVPEAALPG